MTHYWLTDTDGSQYINNPGGPNHASKSNDGGVTWDRPRNNNTVVQREERMDEIMAMAERNMAAEAKRLAALQEDAFANHFGNMETPEAIRERHKARIEALLALKAEVDKKTIGEHLMNVLVCAMVAVAFAGCVRYTIGFIDQIIKTVGTW